MHRVAASSTGLWAAQRPLGPTLGETARAVRVQQWACSSVQVRLSSGATARLQRDELLEILERCQRGDAIVREVDHLPRGLGR
eukprot:scaffold8512_cov65-Phaeocystis_antarctica.AAC.1